MHRSSGGAAGGGGGAGYPKYRARCGSAKRAIWRDGDHADRAAGAVGEGKPRLKQNSEIAVAPLQLRILPNLCRQCIPSGCPMLDSSVSRSEESISALLAY